MGKVNIINDFYEKRSRRCALQTLRVIKNSINYRSQLADSCRADGGLPDWVGEEVWPELTAKGRFYGVHKFCNWFLSLLIVFSNLFFSQAISEVLKDENLGSKTWVEWDSKEGINRLQTCESKENFWKLMRYFETQSRLTYCSVASTVMVLNALGIESPQTKHLGSFNLHTQDTFFSEKVCTLVNRDDVEVVGMSLHDLAQVFPAYPVKIQVYEAINMKHDKIRNILINALKNPKQYVLALYHRSQIEQEGMAHWSPIVAHDTASDSFLILDVARYKYPPVWVDSTAIFNAMQTCNRKGKSRGFIIVEAKK